MTSDFEKKKLFNTVPYAVVTYKQATDIIIKNALERNSYGVSALAVHGFIEAYNQKKMQHAVEKIDLIVADGQPIRWALNSIYGSELPDKVAGPILVNHVYQRSNELKLNIYLYGSKPETLTKLRQYIGENFPGINVCGWHSDRFRESTEEEDYEDIKKINDSGAHIVLVGRGCPRQEKWVSNHIGKINAVMMAVGAAFDFHAGNIQPAPKWMQDKGLEWFFRLIQEPQRLWKRYLFTNSQFIYLFIVYKLKLKA